MLKKIGIALVVLIALFLGFAATRPDSFRVERSIEINAAPEKVFPLVNDFHKWPAWSPWEKMDPDMKRTLGGAASGKGATYAWVGNSKVGSGSMEIVDSVPSSKLVTKLDFIKPFEGHSMAEFTLAPGGAGTKVTWAMYGPNNFIGKCMSVVCSMDKMIGKNFEEGLSAMKTAAETPAPPAPAARKAPKKK